MNKHFYILIFLSIVIFGSGCASLVVGTGGNSSGNDSRSSHQIHSDAAITNQINRAYVKDKNISAVDIRVSTYGGVVTLKGNVSNRKIKTRALSIAKGIKGVKKVHSLLRYRY